MGDWKLLDIRITGVFFVAYDGSQKSEVGLVLKVAMQLPSGDERVYCEAREARKAAPSSSVASYLEPPQTQHQSFINNSSSLSKS